MKKLLLSAAALFLVAASLVGAQIVKDGKAVSEIILAESTDPSLKVAAEEIQKYVKKMTGAGLAIVSKPTGKVPVRIYVGPSALTEKLGVSLADVKHDGFKIVVKGNDIVIAGKDFDWYNQLKLEERNSAGVYPLKPTAKDWEKFTGHKWRSPMFLYARNDWMVRTRPKLEFYTMNGTGTLYGAYHFLEQFGFRWYASYTGKDEDLGKVIPQTKNLAIADTVIKREPQFPLRIYGYYVSTRDNALWVKSMGVGQTELFVPIHLTGRMLDYHEDPELAGKVNGKPDWMAPKLSGKKFRDSFMHYLDCFDRFYPVRLPMTSFGSPDGWGTIDDADRAAGWDKRNRGESGRYSDYYWDFLLDIRTRYNQKYSYGKNIRKHVYAYSCTNRIPELLEKPGAKVPEDFTVVFCYNSDKMHLPGGDFRKNLREWQSKITSPRQLIGYDYYYEHTLYRGERPPLPYIFTANLKKEFAELYGKTDGWLLEGMVSARDRKDRWIGFYRPAINSPMFYLRNKMTWDRNCDPNRELADMCDRYYGPAGKTMLELYNLSESIWMRPQPRNVTAYSGYLKKTDVPKLFALLTKAKAEAGKGTLYEKRIAKLEEEMAPLKKTFDRLDRQGPVVRALRMNAGPGKLDGDLTKPFWKNMAYGVTFKDMNTGIEPGHICTKAAFRFCGGILYIGIECLEPNMDRLKMVCRDRDNTTIWGDDMIEINLETTNGRKPVININAGGAIFDKDPTLPNTADLPSFYRVRDWAVKRLADRWTVEVAIDLNDLGMPQPSMSAPLGIQMGRQRMTGSKPEHYMLSPTGSRFNDHPEMMANLYAR